MKKDINLILSYTKRIGGCLEWTRCLNTDGYPRAIIDGNANAKIHRVVYEILNGPLENGSVVRHTCDNPKCIEPTHLVKGTVADNVKDMDDRERRHRSITLPVITRVLDLLTTKKLKQKEIAKVVGIDARRVSDISNGRYCSATGRFLGHG